MIIEKVISDTDAQLCRVRCGSIFEAAQISIEKNPVIAVVGAGGKTSLIMEMSKTLEREKIRHLVMTTTHMWPFEKTAYRQAVGEIDDSGKLTMPKDIQWQRCIGRMPVLIEADGSRGMPLKVPASHEPVILDQVTHIIGVIGASCLGKTFEKVCQRYQLLDDIKAEDTVTIRQLARIINSQDGLKKSADSRPFSVVINQADTAAERERLMALYPEIINHVDHLILTCR